MPTRACRRRSSFAAPPPPPPARPPAARPAEGEPRLGLGAVGVVLFLVLLGGVIAVSVSPEAQEAFRECGSCERLNCVEIDWFTDKPWWSCCFARNGAGGYQLLRGAAGGVAVARRAVRLL